MSGRLAVRRHLCTIQNPISSWVRVMSHAIMVLLWNVPGLVTPHVIFLCKMLQQACLRLSWRLIVTCVFEQQLIKSAFDGRTILMFARMTHPAPPRVPQDPATPTFRFTCWPHGGGRCSGKKLLHRFNHFHCILLLKILCMLL